MNVIRHDNDVTGYAADTSKGGLYSANNIEPGDYELRINRAERDGVKFAPQDIFGIKVEAGQTASFHVTLTTGIELQTIGEPTSSDLGMDPGRGRLDVLVGDADHVPIGAWVTIARHGNGLNGYAANGDQGGLYSTPNLEPGVYEIRMNRSERDGTRYAPQDVFGVVVEAGKRSVFRVVLSPGIELQTVGEPKISDLGTEPGKGRLDVLVGDSNHLPIGAWVTIVRHGNGLNGYAADGDKGGLYSTPNLAPGRYEIRMNRSERDGTRYAPQDIFGVVVEAGKRTVFRVVLSEGIELQTVGEPTISDLGTDDGRGRLDVLVGDSNHLPIGAWVTIVRHGNGLNGYAADGDKGGLYSTPNLEPDVYDIKVNQCDRDGTRFAAQVVANVTVEAGKLTVVRVTLVEQQ